MLALYIFIGGGIGSVLRYLTTSIIARYLGVNFPYGTLAVNITGSLMMGLLVGYLAKTLPHSMELRAFLAIGVLGGFTTFSAFSFDAVTMFERGELLNAIIYIIISVVCSIAAVFAGLNIIKIV